MTRPSPIILLMGAPLLAAPLFITFAVLALSWRALPWWACLISASLAIRTWAAFFQRRRFKRWMGEWNQMAGPLGNSEPPAKAPAEAKPKAGTGRRLSFITALAVSVFVPWLHFDSGVLDVFALLWLISIGYVVFALGRRLISRRSRIRTSGDDGGTSEDIPRVTLALPLPSHSPSRSQIEADLPEHTAKLIRASRERVKASGVGK